MKHLWLFSLLAVTACHRATEPSSRPEPSSASNGPAPAALLLPDPAPAETHALHWVDPPGWTRKASPSEMRLATYAVPKAQGDREEAELTVFHFGGGQAGGVDANFTRWMSQFPGFDHDKAIRTERTAAGLPEHVLQIESGSFVAMSMRPGVAPAPPKPDYGLLGAIIDTPGGAYFFKLVGPSKTVKAAQAAFLTLLDSVSMTS